MESKERLAYYEKTYLQELDRREKINARLNLPLVISVALIGLLAYMLKNTPPELTGWGREVFWGLFLISCLSLVSAFLFFRLCWFGHTDQLMPTAQEIEDYYQVLKEHYKPYPDSKRHIADAFSRFLMAGYLQYATTNAVNNDRRTYRLYQTTVSITAALLFAFLSFIPFQFSAIAESYIKQHANEVSIMSPEFIE